jgi:purine catabolism regulator
MLPTVAEVLDMPVVRAGDPHVVGGAQGLTRPVRWVHVSDLADVAALLSGRELILTTGQPLAYGTPAVRQYLESLAAAGVSGLVVELGSYVADLPPFVAAAADRLALPVIALRRITRFVEVTEAVHRVIVADQYAELEFAHSVHETFAALSVRRASLAEIVKTAANLLDSSVVLEDLGHRVLALTARHTSAAALLENWETTSRMLSEDPAVVPVGPHTERWGRLILRSRHIPGDRARMALERAAQTLTLHRMIEKDRFGLQRQAQTGLIDDMVAGRVVDEQEAVGRAATLGLARRARYVPVAVRVAGAVEREPGGKQADPVASQRRGAALLDAAGHGVALSGGTALGAADDRQITLILGLGRGGELDPRLEQVCTAVTAEVRRIDGVQRVTIGVGAPADSLLDAARDLALAAHIAEVALSLNSAAPRPFYRSGDVRLRGLLSLIRNEPGVQRFAETELSSLLRHDIRHRSDLTRTLRRFLDLAGNKTELARRMNISRPTLYDRLARIERILGVDLDDGEVRTSLHTALLIRDLGTSTGDS